MSGRSAAFTMGEEDEAPARPKRGTRRTPPPPHRGAHHWDSAKQRWVRRPRRRGKKKWVA